jgi:hypothetical protein
VEREAPYGGHYKHVDFSANYFTEKYEHGRGDCPEETKTGQ